MTGMTAHALYGQGETLGVRRLVAIVEAPAQGLKPHFLRSGWHDRCQAPGWVYMAMRG